MLRWLAKGQCRAPCAVQVLSGPNRETAMTRIAHPSLRELGGTLLALGLTLAGCGGGDPQVRDGGDQVNEGPQTLGAITAGAASFGTNLLIDPSFESRIELGDLPTAPTRWRGDLCVSVAAENGIAPHSGAAMLKFQATGPVPSFGRLTARQWQLVDLSPFAGAIAAGGVRADAGAWFNRVVGSERTDRRFDLRVMAFDGSPADLPARYAANSWLAEDTAPLISVPDSWQQVQASMVLPPGTTYLLVEIYASEDVFNDGDGPEFSGHYADDMSLMLRPSS
jgi:hypothetical protein